MKRKRAEIYRAVAEIIDEEGYMGICWAFSQYKIQTYVDPYHPGIVFSDASIELFPELDMYNLKEYTMRHDKYVSSYLNCDKEDRIIMMLLLAEMNDSK